MWRLADTHQEPQAHLSRPERAGVPQRPFDRNAAENPVEERACLKVPPEEEAVLVLCPPSPGLPPHRRQLPLPSRGINALAPLPLAVFAPARATHSSNGVVPHRIWSNRRARDNARQRCQVTRRSNGNLHLDRKSHRGNCSPYRLFSESSGSRIRIIELGGKNSYRMKPNTNRAYCETSCQSVVGSREKRAIQAHLTVLKAVIFRGSSTSSNHIRGNGQPGHRFGATHNALPGKRDATYRAKHSERHFRRKT